MNAFHVRRLFTAVLLTFPALTSSRLLAQGPGDPPATVARVSYLNGEVSLQAAGSDEWSEAPPNYPMIGGDRLYTSRGSRALVQLAGADLRVWQATDVTLTNQTDNFEQIGLAQGAVRLRVFQMSPGSQIEVDTPNGAVLVETPGDYRIEASPQNGSSSLTVNAGRAQLTGPNINLPLTAGYTVQMYGVDPIQIEYIDVPPYDDFDAWSMDLDRRLEDSVSARYVSRQMVGYGDLDANGTWAAQSEYGPVWYPNNVPDGWRPYSSGHWAYVAPWGYTWVDDAPWGFAPFHYGRWAVLGGRWGWFPGPPNVRPVYSPALVAFVGGNSGLSVGVNLGGGGGIAAWFPIGVGEPYVPWYRCTPTYARQVNVSNVNISAIRNTTVVNNYNTYITNVYVNKTTVNNTTINNTVVNNFNYANRSSVTAVPVATMASGTSVARQQVRLSPQQQQQLARAPVSVRPTAPVPATPHPSLVARPNVAQPAARPTLITPLGLARAVPSAVHAQPVNISRLPPARVQPKNAPPPPAPRPAASQGAVRPGPPAAPSRPAASSAPVAPVIRPGEPAHQPTPTNTSRPAEVVRPDQPVAPSPTTRRAPVTRPANAAPHTPNTQAPPQPRPVQSAPATRPAPPAPLARPATPPPAPARPSTPTAAKPIPHPGPKSTPQAKPVPPKEEPAAGRDPKKTQDSKEDQDPNRKPAPNPEPPQ